MFLGITVTLLILCIFSTIVHSVGVCLLLCIAQYGKLAVQRKYLLHLSICEILFNLFELTKTVSSLISVDGKTSSISTYVYDYIVQLSFTGCILALYLIMTYIAIDRLMITLLKEMYPLYWNSTRANIILIITWVTCIFVSFGLILIREFVGFMIADALSNCYQFLDITYIILAIISCAYICHRKGPSAEMKKRRKEDQQVGEMAEEGLVSVFLKSEVDVPILLMVTFCIVMVIPNFVQKLLQLTSSRQSTLSIGFAISYQLMTLFHGFIYISFHRAAKNKLRKWLGFKYRGYTGDNALMLKHLITATTAVGINVT